MVFRNEFFTLQNILITEMDSVLVLIFSLFISFLAFTSFYQLIVDVQIIVALHHTQLDTYTLGRTPLDE
jgi:hypothetical protein